jgi:hypothetical protein
LIEGRSAMHRAALEAVWNALIQPEVDAMVNSHYAS